MKSSYHELRMVLCIGLYLALTCAITFSHAEAVTSGGRTVNVDSPIFPNWTAKGVPKPLAVRLAALNDLSETIGFLTLSGCAQPESPLDPSTVSVAPLAPPVIYENPDDPNLYKFIYGNGADTQVWIVWSWLPSHIVDCSFNKEFCELPYVVTLQPYFGDTPRNTNCIGYLAPISFCDPDMHTLDCYTFKDGSFVIGVSERPFFFTPEYRWQQQPPCDSICTTTTSPATIDSNATMFLPAWHQEGMSRYDAFADGDFRSSCKQGNTSNTATSPPPSGTPASSEPRCSVNVESMSADSPFDFHDYTVSSGWSFRVVDDLDVSGRRPPGGTTSGGVVGGRFECVRVFVLLSTVVVCMFLMF